MKRYAKVVQSDERGQIVIPKDIRLELGLDQGASYALYVIDKEGIFLKPLHIKELGDYKNVLAKLRVNAKKLKIKETNVDQSARNYKKRSVTNLENV